MGYRYNQISTTCAEPHFDTPPEFCMSEGKIREDIECMREFNKYQECCQMSDSTLRFAIKELLISPKVYF